MSSAVVPSAAAIFLSMSSILIAAVPVSVAVSWTSTAWTVADAVSPTNSTLPGPKASAPADFSSGVPSVRPNASVDAADVRSVRGGHSEGGEGETRRGQNAEPACHCLLHLHGVLL